MAEPNDTVAATFAYENREWLLETTPDGAATSWQYDDLRRMVEAT